MISYRNDKINFHKKFATNEKRAIFIEYIDNSIHNKYPVEIHDKNPDVLSDVWFDEGKNELKFCFENAANNEKVNLTEKELRQSTTVPREFYFSSQEGYFTIVFVQKFIGGDYEKI